MNARSIAVGVVVAAAVVYGVAVAAKLSAPPATPRFVASDLPPLPERADNAWPLLAGAPVVDPAVVSPTRASTTWPDLQAKKPAIDADRARLDPAIAALDGLVARPHLAETCADDAVTCDRDRLDGLRRAGEIDALAKALRDDWRGAFVRTGQLLTLAEDDLATCRSLGSARRAVADLGFTVRLADALGLALAAHPDRVDDGTGSAANVLRTRLSRLPEKPPCLQAALVAEAIRARRTADDAAPHGLARFAPRALFVADAAEGPAIDGYYAAELDHAREPNRSVLPEWPSRTLPDPRGTDHGLDPIDAILEAAADDRRAAEHASTALFDVVRVWLNAKLAPKDDGAGEVGGAPPAK